MKRMTKDQERIIRERYKMRMNARKLAIKLSAEGKDDTLAARAANDSSFIGQDEAEEVIGLLLHEVSTLREKLDSRESNLAMFDEAQYFAAYDAGRQSGDDE